MQHQITLWLYHRPIAGAASQRLSPEVSPPNLEAARVFCAVERPHSSV